MKRSVRMLLAGGVAVALTGCAGGPPPAVIEPEALEPSPPVPGEVVVEPEPERVREPDLPLAARWAAPFAVSSSGRVETRTPRSVTVLGSDPAIAEGLAALSDPAPSAPPRATAPGSASASGAAPTPSRPATGSSASSATPSGTTSTASTSAATPRPAPGSTVASATSSPSAAAGGSTAAAATGTASSASGGAGSTTRSATDQAVSTERADRPPPPPPTGGTTTVTAAAANAPTSRPSGPATPTSSAADEPARNTGPTVAASTSAPPAGRAGAATGNVTSGATTPTSAAPGFRLIGDPIDPDEDVEPAVPPRPASGASTAAADRQPASSSSRSVPGPAAQARTYTVESGDSWIGIARDHGVTFSQLLESNPGADPERIRIGQVLRIPPSTRAAAERNHRVASGDTLSGIARRYGVSVAAIRSANNLTSDVIRPDQVLRIPPAD